VQAVDVHVARPGSVTFAFPEESMEHAQNSYDVTVIALMYTLTH
jgi:hypothetical protein